MSLKPRIITGGCQNVRSTVKVTEKSADLVIGNDKLSGSPVGLVPGNGLIVIYPDSTSAIFYKVRLDKSSDNKSDDFLIVNSQKGALIFSTKKNCEGIPQVLEEISK